MAAFSPPDEMTSMDSMRIRLEGELVGELKKLDLSANEARILLFLMSNGSSTASDISRYTKIQRTDTYHYIGMLLSKGIVFSTFTKPQKYYSLSYEEVIDYLVQAKSNSLREVSEKKHDCQTKLDQISKIVSKDDIEDSYQVLTGENVVVTKLSKALAAPVDRVSIFVTDRMLAKLYHQGVIEQLIALAKSGTKVRLKTPTARCLDDGMASDERKKLHLEKITNPSPASFVIIDGARLLFIIDRSDVSKREITGIYTNNDTMVSTLEYLFERIV
jgi:sugar-specific transcriptional regulator TrmB